MDFLKKIKFDIKTKIIIVIILLILIFAVLIGAGYYPILIVNGSIVTDANFNIDYLAASNFYQKAKTVYFSTSSISTINPKNFQAQILNELVDEALIRNELHKELGSDFQLVVNNKLKDVQATPSFQNDVGIIYGISYPLFRSYVLIPMAEKELLSERLFLNGQNIADWLSSARQSAKVYVIASDFYWNGNSIVAK